MQDSQAISRRCHRPPGMAATGPVAGARRAGLPALLTSALALALVSTLSLALSASVSGAGSLPEPSGEVLLTVSGGIANANAGDAAVFDRAMLEGLGTVSFTTTTIWTDGASIYVGVPLRAVLDAVDARGTVLTAQAINDYSVTFPLDEVGADTPILALLRDGVPMSVRDKGPLWILYPFDANEAYRTEIILGRSVWQLDRLRIHD